MREIKFRAWDGKRMWRTDIPPYYVAFAGNSWGLYHSRDESKSVFGSSSNPDAVLMQFTGLRDKNGKEIFEGDVLKEEGEYSGEVVFVKGAFLVRDVEGLLDMNECVEMPEVIGNLYENPELIKTNQ